MSISKDTPKTEKNDSGAIYQPSIGETIARGRYKIKSNLGHGGMGQVYKAIDTVLDRIVAIKLLNYGRLEGKQAIRFQQEAKALSTLSNDSILSVYDFGLTENGFPFMVTEYVDGLTLRKHLENNSTLNPRESITIAMQIANAMSHAHKNNIVHRDLKPENIILTAGENESGATVKILDFGISKIIDLEVEDQFQTPSGQIVGSPKYISPEQATHLKNVDHRSDIYSLGCILFECLTASPPFLNNNTITTIDAHLNQEAPTLSDKAKDATFSTTLEELVSKCLKKSPEDRYQSMHHLLNNLKEALHEIDSDEDQEKTIVKSSPADLAPLSNSNKVVASIIVVFLLVALLAIYRLLSSEKTDSIGDIQSSQKVEIHNELDIGKGLANHPWVFTDKGKEAKFKSYSDRFPITCLAKLGDKQYDAVEFKGSDVEEGTIKTLALRLPNLNKLTLYESSIANSDIQEIKNFKRLKSLIMKQGNLNDSLFGLLSPMKNLNYLSVEQNSDITKSTLTKIISYFPNLTMLDIGGTSIKPEDLSMLGKLDKLKDLKLQRLGLTDNDISKLVPLVHVRIFDFGHNEKITIKGLKKFPKDRRAVLHLKNLFTLTNKQLKSFKKSHPFIRVKDHDDIHNKLYRQQNNLKNKSGQI